jgi:methyl-galactoside transport system substrate-binding protein
VEADVIMKILRKMIMLILVLLVISSLTNVILTKSFASSDLKFNNREAANVGVIFFKMDDPYTARLIESLKNIEKENPNKVNFNFFDPQNNIAIQNEMLDFALKSNYDLLILYLPYRTENIVEDVINKVKQRNIPLILMNIQPQVVAKVSKLYNKVAFVTPDSKAAGIAQGKIIANLWSNSKSLLDKNGDNVLQYVLLKGLPQDPQVVDRTKYVIETINEAGIKTEELAVVNANWSEDLAKSSIDNLFLKLYDKIEAIISNNDAMAIGAVASLQNYGYNKGDKSKEIAIVGIDGLPEAKDLIEKGFMTGTVIQDSMVGARFLYTVGRNLINNLEPTENTEYKIIDGEVIIPFPYDIYTR